MNARQNILEAIGNTPLIKLEKISSGVYIDEVSQIPDKESFRMARRPNQRHRFHESGH